MTPKIYGFDMWSARIPASQMQPIISETLMISFAKIGRTGGYGSTAIFPRNRVCCSKLPVNAAFSR